jgi:hypothetical protein
MLRLKKSPYCYIGLKSKAPQKMHGVQKGHTLYSTMTKVDFHTLDLSQKAEKTSMQKTAI